MGTTMETLGIGHPIPISPCPEKRRILICQEVMEQVLPGGVVQGRVGVQE